MSLFAASAEVVEQADINALLNSIAPDAYVDDEYDHFLCPDYSQIRALVAKYWDASYISYGADAPDFPLCYDFAELCAAKVREAAIRERLEYRIAFGTVRHTRTDGQRHAICFVVLANCQIKYFEPQDAGVRWMDEPQLLKSLDNFDI